MASADRMRAVLAADRDDEIKALRRRIGQQDSRIAEQGHALAELRGRLRKLEDAMPATRLESELLPSRSRRIGALARREAV